MTAIDCSSEVAVPPRRRDAELNRQRILDVAIDVLAAQPGASIDDIARAAGLVRRTVYGHFPTRDALIHALTEDSISELLAVMATARDGDYPPAVAYARFMLGAWRMAARHRLLLVIGRNELGIAGVAAAMRPVNAHVAQLAAAAQADGTFDDRLPPAALAGILQATTLALLDTLNAGLWDGDPRTAAHACLIAAGTNRRDATRIVTAMP